MRKILNASQRALDNGETSTTPAASQPPLPVSAAAHFPDCFVHETAVVDDAVFIDRGSKIWHSTHLPSGTRIGEGCNIGQNVVIGPEVSIGKNCKIQNNVSVRPVCLYRGRGGGEQKRVGLRPGRGQSSPADRVGL